MAESSCPPRDNASVTVTVTETDGEKGPHTEPTLKLNAEKHKPAPHKVQWEEGTIDNEEMGKKKSKCCCIYEKPKVFGESSSSEDDDETDSCHGHKKKCYRHHGEKDKPDSHDEKGAAPGDPGPSSAS